MMSDYFASWILHCVAALGCCAVWWRLVYACKLPRTAWVSAVILAAVLLVPSRVSPELPYWSPAFMAALLEAISGGESLQQHLRSILGAASLALLFCMLVLRGQRGQKAKPTNKAAKKANAKKTESKEAGPRNTESIYKST